MLTDRRGPYRLTDEQVAGMTDRRLEEIVYWPRDGNGELIDPRAGADATPPPKTLPPEKLRAKFIAIGVMLGKSRAFMEERWAEQTARWKRPDAGGGEA